MMKNVKTLIGLFMAFVAGIEVAIMFVTYFGIAIFGELRRKPSNRRSSYTDYRKESSRRA